MHASWWTSIRAFFGTKIFRELVLVSFILGLYAVFVNYVEHLIFHKDLNFATTITGLFGATISILMVYRTNGAYDRWWEGRKVWGQLVNECRNLVVKTCALSKVPVEEKRAMQELVAAFPPALRDHLRGCRTKDSIVPEGVVHGPAYVTEEVFKKLQSWRDCGSLDDFAFLALDEHALSLLNVCGMCERIQKTPLPLSGGLGADRRSSRVSVSDRG